VALLHHLMSVAVALQNGLNMQITEQSLQMSMVSA